MVKVKIVNKSKNPLPEYKCVGDAGMDLRADLDEPIVLKPLERKLIPTGIYIGLPMGFEAQVRPRSGLALKHGISVINTPGTIDAQYRGSIGVVLINLGSENFIIEHGDRIAQLVVKQVENVLWDEVDVLDDTERGDGGYGHTGVK